ncbi:hypothetical protein Y032_0405g875 [Ancylostoma ceylanicum]|uniref:Uncharacterized protein n=1 Tax=Ancylostoma ceylanicum TaxID=53326 RepID=A0A016X3R6_9BILA|nr:hypothetical protein Y032_0405g875 [Ancylostoma ceylanicum]
MFFTVLFEATSTIISLQKNALNTIFDKTKDVLSTAAETTKGYASQAQQAIGKIIPGASQDHDQTAAGAPAQPAADPTAPATQ